MYFRMRGALGCLLKLHLIMALLAPAALADNGNAIRLNLRDVDIRTFIETVADVTGKKFLVDPRVTGNVTVFSGAPMAKDSMYATFLSVLQVHGFAAVEHGDAIKVTLDQSARQASGPVATQPSPAVGLDRFVTKVIQLQEVEAEKAAVVLRPLVPQNAHLAAHQDSNSLVVSDREANIRRLEQIVSRIDQAAGEGIEVIRLEHADAANLDSVIGKLSGAPAQGGGAGDQGIGSNM